MNKIAHKGLQGALAHGKKSTVRTKTGEKITEPVPKACACGAPAGLVLLRVFHLGSREIRIGACSQFTERRKRSLVLRYGYLFRGWRVWCVDCHSAVVAAGGSVLEDV